MLQNSIIADREEPVCACGTDALRSGVCSEADVSKKKRKTPEEKKKRSGQAATIH